MLIYQQINNIVIVCILCWLSVVWRTQMQARINKRYLGYLGCWQGIQKGKRTRSTKELKTINYWNIKLENTLGLRNTGARWTDALIEDWWENSIIHIHKEWQSGKWRQLGETRHNWTKAQRMRKEGKVKARHKEQLTLRLKQEVR